MRAEKPRNQWDVPVCRRYSILGNPYYASSENKRDYVCDKYEEWFNKSLDKLKPELMKLVGIYQQYGKLRLFCWCAPKRCHAETVKRWLENEIRRLQLADKSTE
jgi:hypothetical protein